jgi:hypothetical protein
MPHARRAPSNDENTPGVLVRVPAAPALAWRVERLRELLKTKNVAE